MSRRNTDWTEPDQKDRIFRRTIELNEELDRKVSRLEAENKKYERAREKVVCRLDCKDCPEWEECIKNNEDTIDEAIEQGRKKERQSMIAKIDYTKEQICTDKFPACNKCFTCEEMEELKKEAREG